MAKRLTFFAALYFICFVPQLSLAQTAATKVKLRHQLLQAMNSSKTTDSLYNNLIAQPYKPALIRGYIGALQALMAKHSWNPYVKLKQIAEAEKSFVKAINAEPDNLELRFLRFSVEYKTPKFLGYSKNLATDRQQLLTLLAKQQYAAEDKDFIAVVINFMLQTNGHTEAEKAELNQYLVALK